MRQLRIKEKELTLEDIIDRFLLVKELHKISELAMRDYRTCLKRLFHYLLTPPFGMERYGQMVFSIN